ncbi:hypothetical protein NP233_g10169 [Leucocoprinus birnbaumii]|uniref:Uncharacterized protein n=1 Tax=Leucocoprinus birnbaumii TaxID=56174 RepID=A0AAD5VPR4_9AGAR|nr:hypothetical protein NP233_g10169 [Leucocoprinus birnbaumii]
MFAVERAIAAGGTRLGAGPDAGDASGTREVDVTVERYLKGMPLYDYLFQTKRIIELIFARVVMHCIHLLTSSRKEAARRSSHVSLGAGHLKAPRRFQVAECEGDEEKGEGCAEGCAEGQMEDGRTGVTRGRAGLYVMNIRRVEGNAVGWDRQRRPYWADMKVVQSNALGRRFSAQEQLTKAADKHQESLNLPSPILQ